jgi:hypothetical protein
METDIHNLKKLSLFSSWPVLRYTLSNNHMKALRIITEAAVITKSLQAESQTRHVSNTNAILSTATIGFYLCEYSYTKSLRRSSVSSTRQLGSLICETEYN